MEQQKNDIILNISLSEEEKKLKIEEITKKEKPVINIIQRCLQQKIVKEKLKEKILL
jgi:hypothetical protein